ncbi:hypothetical protein O9993_09320 [Vibrio lentus]|nr:hypothetical protein [Vibrio lentus]
MTTSLEGGLYESQDALGTKSSIANVTLKASATFIDGYQPQIVELVVLVM